MFFAFQDAAAHWSPSCEQCYSKGLWCWMVVWEQWSSSINLKRKISGEKSLKSTLFHWRATTTFSPSHSLISFTKYTRYYPGPVYPEYCGSLTLSNVNLAVDFSFMCCDFEISVVFWVSCPQHSTNEVNGILFCCSKQGRVTVDKLKVSMSYSG